MEIALPLMSHQKWTCADILSSYRFWGIFFFFLIQSLLGTLGSSYGPYFWNSSLSLPTEHISAIISCIQAGYFLGMVLSWFFCRIKNRNPLYFVALLLIVGTICAFSINDASQEVRLTIGHFLISLSVGIMTLLLPALLFVAIGSTETFVIMFSLCLIAKFFMAHCFPIFIFQLNPKDISTVVITFSIFAVLLLLPLKKQLFYVSPPQRSSSTQRPEYANPMSVALLASCIPFYIVYWFVKIHREMQFVASSPRLMTARGAGWLSAIMPFSAAIMCLMLSDEIRTLLANKKENSGIRTGWTLVWALLYPPVGAAIIQAKMNRFIMANTENPADEG